MKKLLINTIRNAKLEKPLNYCGAEYNTTPTKVEYVGPHTEWDGITLFTDECYDDDAVHIIDRVTSKVKIGWFHEPRLLHGVNGCSDLRHQNAERVMDKFDYFFTYDKDILEKFPDKAIYVVDNAIYLPLEKVKLYDKSKTMSMIFSNKLWAPGHQLRHQIAKIAEGLDLYGSGTGTFLEDKCDGLSPYQFSIAIENTYTKYYFTEKILDCFATGTVPIYWGCPNIGDYFNTKGILTFETLEDLAKIFESMADPEYYNKLLPYVKENYNTVQQYRIYEDWMFDNVYKNLTEKHGIHNWKE